MEKQIYDFLNNRTPKTCSFSTVKANCKPQSAIMGYAVLPDLTVILSTHKNTRKYHNLEENPYVSLIFGTTFTEPNIQYEGLAETIVDGDSYKLYEELYFSIHPEAKQFKSDDTIFIKIIPTWIRCSDYTQHPPKIEEKEL